PPCRGRGQAQPGAQRGRGDRPVLQDQPGDPGPGAALGAQRGDGACGAGHGNSTHVAGATPISRDANIPAVTGVAGGRNGISGHARNGTGVTSATSATRVTAAVSGRKGACPVHAFHYISLAYIYARSPCDRPCCCSHTSAV